jgi:hypothetical protein
MSELTFAEAMALDPSEVEVCFADNWYPLRGIADSHTLATFRCAKFRRAKPKRSRVQEMAGVSEYDHRLMASTIRAVCEWLRSKQTDLHEFKDVAPYIEREFLEPR